MSDDATPNRARAALAFGFLVEHQAIAMQAAWIEWRHGRGAEAAMGWIENTLDGPDLLPEVEDGADPQAFFDAAMKDSRRREREAEQALTEHVEVPRV